MANKEKNAISPTRAEDYPEWYQQIVKAADLAENSPVRGCMVIKPWGYGIWERIQSQFDQMIKATGHENAYFPLFIPLSFLEREAKHVEGFAKECAVVTHHRLEERDGKLVPTGELEEPLIIRPTSETIIGESFKKWIQSYRDLPLLINQWANVVRWEMRPRLFLRTAEFLWQEGHTAHATEQDARDETLLALELYRKLAEEIIAMPVIVGEKTPLERFPGAVDTYCIEAMMQDRKALQAGTSHYLGQNFAEAVGIRFLNDQGEHELVHTTSWGVSTRLIGGLIMTHADDDGLRLPPRVAPKHAVILPVIPGDQHREGVLAYAEEICNSLKGQMCFDLPLVADVDARDLRGGEKNWQWIKRGVPVRIEVGPRDREKGNVVLMRRDKPHREKEFLSREELVVRLPEILKEIQQNYFDEARAYRDSNIVRDIDNFDDFIDYFTPEDDEKPEIHGGFVYGKFCCEDAVETDLANIKVSVRCIPTEQSGGKGKCIITGRDATVDAVFAKAY